MAQTFLFLFSDAYPAHSRSGYNYIIPITITDAGISAMIIKSQSSQNNHNTFRLNCPTTIILCNIVTVYTCQQATSTNIDTSHHRHAVQIVGRPLH